ncbi:putative RNA helicase [Heterostelium album PN500]|uniref:Putative RNA helicase n=1 Tax=Heterostelium pallidum (strain ATCC 26659 / Pp 5 / PN500) TaxID=670386 RepID=D3BK58_HETP5|nr:putative RNA helicase [Heterostelium album PN500]EFA78288.1 putative RNA helicase [Heterostelium album PN500]|eukprot:XP_020430413.1 putative RNA helicase [Heterostelium album PN500]
MALIENPEEDTVVTFEKLGVDPQIVEACKKLGFKNPTEIQRKAIPEALAGKDIVGLAQTGSGKTAAFSIPMLQALLAKPSGLFGLVLAPTRELAVQISDQIEALGAVIGVKCAVLVGGIDTMSQSMALAKKPHIIVGTPGRVVYHLENTKGFNLKTLKYFVMDEADRLLGMDFEEEINTILKVIPKDRNTFLFSATMTSKVAKLQRASLNDPVKIQVATKYSTVDTLQQEYIFIPYKHKECYLTYILNELAGNSVIIFTSTCAASTKLAIMLRNLSFKAIPINGQMDQSKRLSSLNKFKAQTMDILVATDVAARGLDIPSVDLVINYDVPVSSKEYMHRVGRTARAGRTGRAVTLVTQYDVEIYLRIEHALEQKLEEFPTEQESVLVFSERVNEAIRVATNEIKEAGLSEKEKRSMDDSEQSTGHLKKRKVEKKVIKKKNGPK